MPALLSQIAAHNEGTEMCSVRVGQALYGIPVTRILEILGKPEKLPVPLAPGFIGGLAQYRG